jgi:hypothetical protein
MDLQERVERLEHQCSELQRKTRWLNPRPLPLAVLVVLTAVAMALVGYLCLRFF